MTAFNAVIAGKIVEKIGIDLAYVKGRSILSKLKNIKGVVNGLNSEVHFVPYMMNLDKNATDLLDIQIPYEIRFLPVNQKIVFFSVALPEEEKKPVATVSKLMKLKYPSF